MLKLVSDANEKVKSIVLRNNVMASYHAVCDDYTKGYVHSFVTHMQKLITKLGIIVETVSIGEKTSYCRDSIRFLCVNALDNPGLEKTFHDIGLNTKGNIDKHDIEDINIDMLRCVTAYNNLVNRIADVYGLKSLTKLVVRKNSSAKKENPPAKQPPEQRPVYKKPDEKKAQAKKTGVPLEKAALSNDEIALKATLSKGFGRYQKGIFGKKEMVNFKLDIKIDNKQGFKISSIKAIIKGKGDQTEKKLPTFSSSTTEFDLPTDAYGGNVSATVVVVYKIGTFKSKELKVTVSKNF